MCLNTFLFLLDNRNYVQNLLNKEMYRIFLSFFDVPKVDHWLVEHLFSKGIKEIRTDNEINNPMYKINEKLGFYPVPSSLEYLKNID